MLSSAAEHYRAQQRLTVLTVAAARKQWRRMGRGDFDASWRRIAPGLVVLTSAAQLRSARNGAESVPKMLAETNQVDDAVAEVNARAFAGVASDGRTLDGLLYTAVTTSKTAVGNGYPPGEALALGGRWLDGALQTVVADAGRQAAGVAVAARPKTGGYVRMLNPPSCPLCAQLAGRFYRWNAGFARHKFCDCVHIPASENVAGDLRTDPDAMFASGQVTGLTTAETRALTEGADFSQVVNARRGALTDPSGRRFTTEGTTKRGDYGRRAIAESGGTKSGRYRRANTPRLTPEQIYRDATDRGDAIRLLERFGYLR